LYLKVARLKAILEFVAILLVVRTSANAQVAQAAVGGPLTVPLSGTLHYDVHYSISDWHQAGRENQTTSTVSGDAGYANTSERLPFNMNYGGGYNTVLAGPSEPGSFFQHLSLSQAIFGRKWNASASDDVGYYYQSPTTGFSGVPGTGDLNGSAPPSTPTNQSILSQNSRNVDNIASVNLARKLDFATTFTLGGTATQLRFLDGNGLDTDTVSANAGLMRRLTARNTIGLQYSYSVYTFTDLNLSSHVNTAQGSFSRQWGPHLSTSVSAGPQWISSSDNGIIPASTRVAVSASLNDVFKFGRATLNYSQGMNGGSGLLIGAEADVVSGQFSRQFGRRVDVTMTGSYMRTSGLQNNGVTNTELGGAQVTRRLGRYFSVYAAYTGISQSSTSALSPNAIGGLIQVFTGGIGFTPREFQFRK